MPSIISSEAVDHPQLDYKMQTGMKIIGNVVELTEEDKVLDWLLHHKKQINEDAWKDMTFNMFRCCPYEEDKRLTKELLNLTDRQFKHFNYDNFLIDECKNGSFNDGNDDVFMVLKYNHDYELFENEYSFNIQSNYDKIYVVRQL
jgi:hypothetical protein